MDRSRIKENYKVITKLKNKDLSVFKDKDDEDINLCSEYFAYCTNTKEKPDFLSLDKNLIHSMNTLINKHGFRAGKIINVLE